MAESSQMNVRPHPFPLPQEREADGHAYGGRFGGGGKTANRDTVESKDLLVLIKE
jgi:hypothetical protein